MFRIDFHIKQRIIELSGACFWYWRSYYTFLESCGVSTRLLERYPRDAFNKYDIMRNLLNDLEQADDTVTINNIVSTFYRMQKAADNDVPDGEKAKRLLMEFRESVGNDPIEQEIERRRRHEVKEKYEASIQGKRTRREKLEALNRRFMQLHTDADITAQQRGYRLEDIFCDLLQLSELEYATPFRHAGEQIDGHFRYEKFDYLIECKWIKAAISQTELAIFDGKIRGKAQSTRGFLLAANGFDDNAIAKYSGDSPRIILMTGEDLALVMGGQVDFTDALKGKVEAIVRHGNICFPVRNIL